MTKASYIVTLYRLFLGDQDSVIGHYRKGFTIHSIVAPIYPRGTALIIANSGYYTKYDYTGLTEYDVDEGDILFDSFDRYYEIKSRKPWTNGDQFAFYELELEEMPVFPFISDFFGFEDLEHGKVGYEFEPGFERGYFAL